MASSFKERVCEALIAKKLVSKQQLATALKDKTRAGKPLGRILVERGLVSEEKLFSLVAEELAIPILSLTKYRLDPELAKLVPERVARKHLVVPVSRLADRLVVAMCDPLNLDALDDLKRLTDYSIDLVLAQEAEIRRAIEQLYAGQSSALSGVSALQMAPDGPAVPEDLDTAVQTLLSTDATGEAPVVQVVNMMIMEALLKRASDIHLEPLDKHLRVRYRVDGHLIESHTLPKQVQSPVLTRLKIMSGCDIAEWRLPQDGRFKVRLANDQEVDFRVSVLPVIHGAKVVCRVLDKKNLSIGLEQLGLMPDAIKGFKDAVKRPYGMILVTGPTGSGKSTTLYSVLNQLNQPTRNIITIEDPVEYQVEGITQVQVNTDIGLTFASGLRALLRQSPDVVMIGEIRDFETADIALKASLTGQLVLSTLHTNDAASAITRLVDMGIEPFLVASSVQLIEAQRLVRRLCQKCRKAYDPPIELLKRLGVESLESVMRTAQAAMVASGQSVEASSVSFYQAGGCHACNGTGYYGRLSLVEVFTIDEQIRELIVNKCQSWEIKDYAVKNLGLVPLRQDGMRKAVLGITTLEEVLRVTSEE